MKDNERKLYKSATHLGYSKIAYFDTLNRLKGKRKRGIRMKPRVKKWKSISVNIMDEVAALKGKELNEPFMVESNVHKVAKQVRFTERGMEYFDESCQRWYPTDGFLKEILTGDAVIVSNE